MSKLKISEIISFSSEDPANPASNLLEPAKFRKWKCKEPGESTACVIFQLEKAVSITGIDIGNEGSAIVEVLVSRSGSSSKSFEVLLSSAILMGPAESKELQNCNRVRMFRKDKLDKEVMSQKWDIIKVVCTQPYNKRIQYGLSFITFFQDAEPAAKNKIGAFKLLSNDDDDEEPNIRIGSFFAKRMESDSKKSSSDQQKLPPSPSTSTILRSSPALSLASAAFNESERKAAEILARRKLASTESGRAEPDSEIMDDDQKMEKDQVQKKATNSSSSKLPAVVPNSKINPPIQPTTTSTKSASSSGSNKNTSNPKKQKAPKMKLFSKLFEDVTFVMSGYENPYRGELRRKGVEMGGKCKPDWDSSCTHLICAFVNTPKFRQVKSSGRGKIVSKKWIEDCYQKRRRLPWRRFHVDRNDQGSESEDEILAEPDDSDVVDNDDSNNDENASQNSTKANPSKDDNSSNENKQEENSEEESPKKKRKRILVVSSSDEEEDETKTTDPLSSHYNADTDVDEDCSNNNEHNPKEQVQEGDQFFSSSIFYIKSVQDESEGNQIESIIKRHNGKIETSLSDSVEFLITDGNDWNEEFSEALSENPNLTIVNKEWIAECEKKNELISPDSFMILPN